MKKIEMDTILVKHHHRMDKNVDVIIPSNNVIRIENEEKENDCVFVVVEHLHRHRRVRLHLDHVVEVQEGVPDLRMVVITINIDLVLHHLVHRVHHPNEFVEKEVKTIQLDAFVLFVLMMSKLKNVYLAFWTIAITSCKFINSFQSDCRMNECGF